MRTHKYYVAQYKIQLPEQPHAMGFCTPSYNHLYWQIFIVKTRHKRLRSVRLADQKQCER